jgi:metal-responsive CopG/Arc/MetJ family transcriptional regulator
MRQTKIGKITVSATLELSQVERLNEAARRSGVSRSTIFRDAVERELKRYEENQVEAPAQKRGSTTVPETASRHP